MTSYDSLPPPFRRIVIVIDSISTWIGKIFCWLIIPMIGALVYEVFSRYLFNSPTVWAYDMTYMIYGTHFMLGAAFTSVRQAHVRTDFLYQNWSPRWQGIVDSTLYVFLYFPAIGLFTWAGYDFAATAWEYKEVGITGPWAPPLYPFKAVIPVTGAMLCMQGVSELIKSLHAAIKGEWPS